MGALALSLVVAAMGSSPVVVALPFRTVGGVAPERAVAVADRVAQLLQAEGVPLSATASEVTGKLLAEGADPTKCRGEASCAARMGAKLGANLVVGVGVGEFQGSVAVHLEVVEVPFAERSQIEDQVLPSDLKDPQWTRAVAPFAGKLREHIAAMPPPPMQQQPTPQPMQPSPVATEPSSRDWVIALQADSEIGSLGGMVTVRAGRRFLPELTVSAGALLTGARLAGATVQARAVPFVGDLAVRPVLALEVPVMLIRSSPTVGVRPSLGVEVTPLPWLSLGANASYLRLVGVDPAEVTPGYWLGGAEVGFRL
ncbi:MAG TPA: hypothetical protein VIG99_07815 [Myxococcaceae bacterium]